MKIKKKAMYVILGAKVLILTLMILLCLGASGMVGVEHSRATAYAEQESVVTETADTGVENADIFSRLSQWVEDNSNEIISAIGVVITLVIIPVLRNIGTKSDRVGLSIADAENRMIRASDEFSKSADHIAEIVRSGKNIGEEASEMRAELMELRGELNRNTEILNSVLNSVYTAFMGSSISDGVKDVLSGYMRHAMDYQGEKEIAREKLSKTKDLISDVQQTVESIETVLEQRRSIDR